MRYIRPHVYKWNLALITFFLIHPRLQSPPRAPRQKAPRSED